MILFSSDDQVVSSQASTRPAVKAGNEPTIVARGATLTISNAATLGDSSRGLTVNGTLRFAPGDAAEPSMNVSVGKFSSRNSTIAFRINKGSIDKITCSSNEVATMDGYTGIELDARPDSVIMPGVYTLISAEAGGLGGKVGFAGGENLTVPASTAIQTIGGSSYRLTLAASGSAITVTVSEAPPRTVYILPMGASISAGQSVQDPYDGGGYRSQLYQLLVNDGRFTPRFCGLEKGSYSHNPTGPDLMTAVGQSFHEGHPGWPTGALLDNLAKSFLKPGNGVNPDYIMLNIGGNDYVYNSKDENVVGRLDQILNTIASLRPDATTVVSDIMIRTDGGGAAARGFNALYNPHIPDLVRKHVLLGHHVVFLDFSDFIKTSDLGPDHIHPLQAGYNKMADAWYRAIATGQAFYTGAAGASWSSLTPNGESSFAQDFRRITDAKKLPSSETDVYFNGVGGSTMLGQDFTIRSLNFTTDAKEPVNIGGDKLLTIGSTFTSVTEKIVNNVGGITLLPGTGSHTISSDIQLAVSQTWTNASDKRFTVSGKVASKKAIDLTINGSGVIVLSGENTYEGKTEVSSGTLEVANSAGSATGSSTLTIADGATLTGSGRVAGETHVAGTVVVPSNQLLTTAKEIWHGGSKISIGLSGETAKDEHLKMSELVIDATSKSPVEISVMNDGGAKISEAMAVPLLIDLDTSNANPFGPTQFDSTTRSKLKLNTSGIQPSAGLDAKLTAKPVRDATTNAVIGHGLFLTHVAQVDKK